MVSKALMRAVVTNSEKCQLTDPPSMCWLRGKLDISNTWSQVGMEVTHYQSRHYLSFIDCGPTQFSIWRHLRRQDTASVISHRVLAEILADNDSILQQGLLGLSE